MLSPAIIIVLMLCFMWLYGHYKLPVSSKVMGTKLFGGQRQDVSTPPSFFNQNCHQGPEYPNPLYLTLFHLRWAEVPQKSISKQNKGKARYEFVPAAHIHPTGRNNLIMAKSLI